MFEGILEQLRALRSGEITLPLPTEAEMLRAMLREAKYFALDGKPLGMQLQADEPGQSVLQPII